MGAPFVYFFKYPVRTKRFLHSYCFVTKGLQTAFFAPGRIPAIRHAFYYSMFGQERK